MAHVVLFLVCSLFDEILSVLFPNTFLVNDLLFIPNLAFCMMILTIRKFSLTDKCLFAFGCGMFYDFCFAKTFLLYAIIYTLLACILHLWSKHLTETLIESLILSIVTIFVKDLLVYFVMSFQGISEIPFLLWAEQFELLTLLGNAVLVLGIVFLQRSKEDYLEKKANKIRRREKIQWFNLKSKE